MVDSLAQALRTLQNKGKNGQGGSSGTVTSNPPMANSADQPDTYPNPIPRGDFLADLTNAFQTSKNKTKNGNGGSSKKAIVTPPTANSAGKKDINTNPIPQKNVVSDLEQKVQTTEDEPKNENGSSNMKVIITNPIGYYAKKTDTGIDYEHQQDVLFDVRRNVHVSTMITDAKPLQDKLYVHVYQNLEMIEEDSGGVKFLRNTFGLRNYTKMFVLNSEGGHECLQMCCLVDLLTLMNGKQWSVLYQSDVITSPKIVFHIYFIKEYPQVIFLTTVDRIYTVGLGLDAFNVASTFLHSVRITNTTDADFEGDLFNARVRETYDLIFRAQPSEHFIPLLFLWELFTSPSKQLDRKWPPDNPTGNVTWILKEYVPKKKDNIIITIKN